MAASAFLAASTLVAFAGLLKRRSRFDDFGLADLLFVLVSLLPLALLLKDRSWYVRPSLDGQQGQPGA
jgi:hypothetical protein